MGDDIFLYMRSHPLWEDFEEELISRRPVVPAYDPGNDNTEKWKHESSKQEGFDLCLTLFKIGVENG